VYHNIHVCKSNNWNHSWHKQLIPVAVHLDVCDVLHKISCHVVRTAIKKIKEIFSFLSKRDENTSKLCTACFSNWVKSIETFLRKFATYLINIMSFLFNSFGFMGGEKSYLVKLSLTHSRSTWIQRILEIQVKQMWQRQKLDTYNRVALGQGADIWLYNAQ